MFKISFYIKKKDHVSIEDFRQYWLGEHAELVKDYLSIPVNQGGAGGDRARAERMADDDLRMKYGAG